MIACSRRVSIGLRFLSSFGMEVLKKKSSSARGLFFGTPRTLVRRPGRPRAHAGRGQIARQELDRGQAVKSGEAFDRAGAHVFLSPFDALVPFDIGIQQKRDLFLGQLMAAAKVAEARRNKIA